MLLSQTILLVPTYEYLVAVPRYHAHALSFKRPAMLRRGGCLRLDDLADKGEDHAYDALGLERGAEFKEVRKRYKELAREWHPDHHQGDEMKLKAQE